MHFELKCMDCGRVWPYQCFVFKCYYLCNMILYYWSGYAKLKVTQCILYFKTAWWRPHLSPIWNSYSKDKGVKLYYYVDQIICVFFFFFERSTFVGSAWSFVFFIPATTADDLLTSDFEGFPHNISAILTIALCDSCKNTFLLRKIMQFFTCEKCDFMVHKTTSITNFPGAVTCDKWDPIFPSCEE